MGPDLEEWGFRRSTDQQLIFTDEIGLFLGTRYISPNSI